MMTEQEAFAKMEEQFDGIEEKLELLKKRLENGSQGSPGAAGARGPLTHVSEILDPRQIDAFPTPGDGSKPYPVRLLAISSASNGEREAVYIAMVSCDSETAQRLLARLSGEDGLNGTEDVESFLLIPNVEPLGT